MASITGKPWPPRKAVYLRGVMIDTVRGTIRVRKWPKKRGPPTSEKQLFWIDWFRQANKLAQYADGMTRVRAIQLTEKWPLYPRDLILKAMRGRLYSWVDQNGWKWYPMAAIGDVSESLDVLAQTVGSVLVRATDRWRSAVAGSVGDRLTYNGSAAPPSWEPDIPAAPPFNGALVTRTTNQSIPNGTLTSVIWDAKDYDDDDIWEGVTNPSRLTVPATWTKARVVAGAAWDSNNVGLRLITILKNGAQVLGAATQSKPASLNAQAAVSGPVVRVVAGDYFELGVIQGSGANLNILGGDAALFFGLERLA